MAEREAVRGVARAVGTLVEAMSVELVDHYLELLCRGEREISRAVLEIVVHFGEAGRKVALPRRCMCGGPVACATAAQLASAVRETLAVALVAETLGAASLDSRCARLLKDGRALLRLISGRRPPSGAAVRRSDPPGLPGSCSCSEAGTVAGGKSGTGVCATAKIQ